MSKKTIAFVTGGYSGEAVISYMSAITIENNIDTEKYNYYKIDIQQSGWIYTAENGEHFAIDKNDFSLDLNGNKVTFDAVLIGIHGTPGEDGKLQGYFDMLHIPYTSCDAATSALTFNKRYTVATVAFGGIKVAKSVLLIKDNFTSADEIVSTLHFPVFVKPNNGGSSIGMSKVNEGKGLAGAIEKAFKEDDQVLIEEFIQGREFTIGVFKTRGEIVVLPICEVSSKKDFFDYEAKYTAGLADEIIPAPIEEGQADILRAAATKVYHVFNCKGIVRIDFIWHEEEGKPYMLEINTVPGQSENSLVPKMVGAHGWTMKEFYSRQLEEIIK